MTGDVDTILKAADICITMRDHGAQCYKCPYATLDLCASELADDVARALGRLKIFEKPTREEQPVLPGMEE